eukprot:954319_1
MAIYTDNSNPIQHIESYPRGSNQTSNVLICYGSRLPNEISTVHPMTWALWACKHDHTYANLFQFELLRVKTLNKVVLRITINNFCPLEAKSKYSQMFRVVLFEKVSHNQYNSSASNHTTNQYPSSSQQTTHTTIGDTPKGPTPNGYSSTIQSESHRPSPPATPPQSQPNAMPSARSVHNAEDYQEEKERILKKEITEPKLPRFEFDHFDTFILDIDELSLSDPDSFCSPPPLPMTVIRPRINPLNNQNASNPPSQAFPPVNDDPVPPPSSKPEQKANIDPQRKNKKAERADEPVLARIFGDTDAHQGYQKYHKEARIKYAEQLKAAPKIEKNPKNYFLLLILPDWKHTIGNKIGLRDYGFHSDAGLNSKNGSKGRDSNKYHGVDFEVKGKDDDKPNKQPKQATSIILEVMQAKQFIPNQDYRYAPQGNGPQGFGCAFVFKGQSVAQGYGKNKSEAKRKCSRNAVSYFKGDPELSGCINRIELRIKPGKKDAPPVGYEYPVQLYDPMFGRRYRYEFVSWHPQHQVPLQQSYNYNNVTVFEDRGLLDNPSVEKMYFQQWGTFKGKGNIPVHCHEYLNSNRRFIKPFKDETERRIWKAIWQAYEPKPNNDCDKGAPHADLRSAQDEHELIIYSKDKANAPFTHCLMFDFDGTVYAQQLRHLWKEQNKLDGITMMQYINVLIAEDQVINGFGGLERTKALKELFQILRNYKGRLCVAMSTFQVKEDINLQPLFDVMDVNMDEWFDVIVDAHHVIGKKLFADKHNTQVNHRHWKDRMISKFCDIYGIPRENVLYVDDDRKIKRKVVCCEVFQAQNRGKGLTPEEMKAIVTNVQQKWFPAKQDIELNEEKN